MMSEPDQPAPPLYLVPVYVMADVFVMIGVSAGAIAGAWGVARGSDPALITAAAVLVSTVSIAANIGLRRQHAQ
jgi:hypothetical protein